MGNKPSFSADVEHITQEMYKKNFELAERNKTLSVLRKIETIALSSVTDMYEVMQSAAKVIVSEAEFRYVSIHQVNHNKSALIPLAIETAKPLSGFMVGPILSALKKNSLSLKSEESIMSRVVSTKRTVKHTRFYFVIFPLLDMLSGKQLQTAIGATTFFVHPLIVRGTVIGVLTIGLEPETEYALKESRELINRLPNSIAMALDNAVLYQSIRQANERLKELDHLKDEFVSIASHELRTPMTAIKSYIWMALNKKGVRLDSKVREYLEIANTSSERLIKLVGDMLTISRIEGKRLQLTTTEVSVQDLVHTVYNELLIKANEQNITFTIKVPRRKIIIHGDKDKLSEILHNLIGNALKFTQPKGIVTVTVVRRQHDVEVQVHDTGPGMSKENIGKLFQKFGMLGDSYKHASPAASGTGLGLYITKQIIAMHKGKIWVESTLGSGSTFFFTLPLK